MIMYSRRWWHYRDVEIDGLNFLQLKLVFDRSISTGNVVWTLIALAKAFVLGAHGQGWLDSRHFARTCVMLKLLINSKFSDSASSLGA